VPETSGHASDPMTLQSSETPAIVEPEGVMFEMLDGRFVVVCLVTFNALAVKAGKADWLSAEEALATFAAHRMEIEEAADRIHEPGRHELTIGARDLCP
jgi:hypothetical protein